MNQNGEIPRYNTRLKKTRQGAEQWLWYTTICGKQARGN